MNNERFPGLTDTPGARRLNPRSQSGSMHSRDRLARRSQLQNRFKDLLSARSTSEHRVLRGLKQRGGVLARAKKGATRRRIDLRK